MSEVLEYLRQKNVEVKTAPGNEVRTACFFHGEEPGKRGRLYINIDPNAEVAGLFFCHVCGERGGLKKIMKHFGDTPPSDKPDRTSNRHEILEAAAEYYHERMLEKPDIYSWLKNERKLTMEVISTHQLGWADGGLLDHLKSLGFKIGEIAEVGLITEHNGQWSDFLRDEVVLPYHVNKNVVTMRGKKLSGKYRTLPKQSARLFNSDVVWEGNNEIVVCEGEFDAMVLEGMGFHACAVSGANTWKDSWDDYFSEADIIYVCYDPDPAGTVGAGKLLDRLGSRARLVNLPVEDGQVASEVDPTWLAQHGWGEEEFARLFRDSRFAGSPLITVYDAYEEWQSLQGQQGLRLGFEELDAAINPGLLPSQVMVILAKTNTGKTIILLNMFQRISMEQPDAKMLFVSLEQTRGDWFERARRIWNFHNLDCPPDQVHKRTLEYWRDRLMIVDKNRLNEEELIAAIEEYIAVTGRKPDLMAVDYLGYLARGFKGKDRYEKVSEAVMSLKAVAKEMRIAIVSPHQVSRMAEFGMELDIDNARDSGAVEETADFVCGLWAPDAMKGKDEADYSGQVILKIGKSRHGGKGTKIHLQFAPLTLAMVQGRPLKDPRQQHAMDELQYRLKRMTWEEAIVRHKVGLPQGVSLDSATEAF